MKSTNLRIGMYAGSWPQNIGNAFFDFGAEAIIREAFPSADIYRVGGAVHWMFNNSRKTKFGILSRIFRKLFPLHHSLNGNSIEIGQIAELDLLVFAGMSMCEEFVLNNGPTFIEANKRGVAILGLGAGGSLYNSREVEKFSTFFGDFKNAAIITRDDDTFNLFNKSIRNISKGIDCAFFLPDYFTPPKISNSGYQVLTFDSSTIPNEIKSSNHDTYYAHHDLWGPLSKSYISKPKTLISDVPEDYLTLYANCSTTFSDRVHACIASLAYGNFARLYSDTPRKALFEKVGAQDVTKSVIKLDAELLAKLKKDQVANTIRIVRDICKVD